MPPHSSHFDASMCIKPKRSMKPDDTPMPEAHVPIPQMNAYPQYPPPPLWAYGQYPMPGYGPVGPHAYAPPPPHYNPPYGHQPSLITTFQADEFSVSSPGVALRLHVPLADFCAWYEISKSDEEKLALLEYKPGNQEILKLEAEDWKGVKFTKLGWTVVLQAHKKFI